MTNFENLSKEEKMEAIKQHKEMLEILRNEYKDTMKRLNLAIAEKAAAWEIKALKQSIQSIIVDGKSIRKSYDALIA